MPVAHPESIGIIGAGKLGRTLASLSLAAGFSVLLHGSGPRARTARIIETFAPGAVAATLAFYAVRMVLQSHEFEEISQGVDATPLWIPQLSMAFGSVVLLIALIDDLVMTTLGRAPARLATHSGEAARME